eukprot:scaffold54588_cov40-Prasinocladus_malaysianus.AAC.1
MVARSRHNCRSSEGRRQSLLLPFATRDDAINARQKLVRTVLVRLVALHQTAHIIRLFTLSGQKFKIIREIHQERTINV